MSQRISRSTPAGSSGCDPQPCVRVCNRRGVFSPFSADRVAGTLVRAGLDGCRALTYADRLADLVEASGLAVVSTDGIRFAIGELLTDSGHGCAGAIANHLADGIAEIPGPGHGPLGEDPRKGALREKKVREAMKKAWDDSKAGDPAKRHEEAGWIVQNDDGSYDVIPISSGGKDSVGGYDQIVDGKINGKRVVGRYHTHPNPPPEYEQGPSPADKRNCEKYKLGGEYYVISGDKLYRVNADGSVTELPKSYILVN